MHIDGPDACIQPYIRPSAQEIEALHEPSPDVVRARDHADAAFYAVWSYADEKAFVRDRPVEEVKYFTYPETDLAAYGQL